MRFRDLVLVSLLAGCGASRPAPVAAPAAPAKVVIAPTVTPAPLDRAAVRRALAARREIVFARFLAYREARVYPINTLPGGGFRHVWQDPEGHLCAAATLVSLDWGRDAAVRAAGGNVEIKMADQREGALEDWILTSGLARHEIVAIQVPGWSGERGPVEQPPPQPDPQLAARQAEIQRLYGIYIDVERQLRVLAADSLDEATDALMKRPDLARAMIAGKIAAAPTFAQPVARG